MLKDHEDAYGREIYDFMSGKEVLEIVERDDGYIDVSSGPAHYFAPYEGWPVYERKGMKYVCGKVLDIGCGAGRIMHYLKGKGFDVTGIDTSPLAVKVCRTLGLESAHVLPITKLSRRLGMFDTVVMYGNNFGLFGGFDRARWLLRRMAAVTSDRGRIIAATTDPHKTNLKVHKEYQKRNRAKGRMPGQLRIRVRYSVYATPYFDYLLASKAEVRRIVKGTGWKVASFVDSKGPQYLAIIEKA